MKQAEFAKSIHEMFDSILEEKKKVTINRDFWRNRYYEEVEKKK